MNDIQKVTQENLPWQNFNDKTVLITGATGLLGRFLIDVIMYLNNNSNINCTIIAIGRNIDKARAKFSEYWTSKNFSFITHDINFPLVINKVGKVDYVIHLASNTHPKKYALDPIGTITANVIGTKNLLDFSVEHEAERFAFASSNEIYGENRGDTELFGEDYCGYINSNTLRAGYPESKRCGESLCQAYASQKKIDVVIPRFTRSYGPTMLMSDTKVISQFIMNGLRNENIVLKSDGKQFYSYTYVADAVSGLLYVLLLGKCREAYNIADQQSNIRLRDLAQIVADNSNTKVVYNLPGDVEKVGSSKVKKAILDGSKLHQLGWRANFDISEGVKRTIKILESETEDYYE